MRQLTYDWCKYGFAPVIKASAKAYYTQTTGYIGHKWHLIYCAQERASSRLSAFRMFSIKPV